MEFNELQILWKLRDGAAWTLDLLEQSRSFKVTDKAYYVPQSELQCLINRVEETMDDAGCDIRQPADMSKIMSEIDHWQEQIRNIHSTAEFMETADQLDALNTALEALPETPGMATGRTAIRKHKDQLLDREIPVPWVSDPSGNAEKEVRSYREWKLYITDKLLRIEDLKDKIKR